ncbi:MAG TPA: hypothetical protein VF377_10485 [Acidimicrobiia bacterium]
MTDINVKVEAGFGHTILDASPTWTDITTKLVEGRISRGRDSVDQRFETGTGHLILDNRDGRFTRTNTSGTYYPNVKLGVPIRITATINDSTVVYPIFYGEARGWPGQYFAGAEYAETEVILADGFYTLNQEDLAGFSYDTHRTDERIDAVLDDINWPDELRDLDTGLANVQAKEFAAPGDGSSYPALSHLLDVAESEAGVLFMSSDGKVTFRNRIALAAGSAVATYDGTDDYMDIEPKDDDDVFYNVIRIAREDGAQIEFDGSGSGPRRVLARDVMPMNTDTEARSVAEWLYGLFGENRLRIDGLKFKPRRDATLAAELLGLELRDIITIQFDPPGSGDTFNEDCVVEKIEHQFRPKDWTTILSVAPITALEAGPFFTLDASTLDGTDILA